MDKSISFEEEQLFVRMEDRIYIGMLHLSARH